MKRLVLVTLFALFGVCVAIAADSKPYQKRFCAGMKMEKRVDYGGRVDCLSDEYAIEVEWIDEWYSAVGQSLYYAVVTKRKPGIILLCKARSDDVHGEGLCRSYVYRLSAALSAVKPAVTVWERFAEDRVLSDCFRPDMTFE